VESKILNFPDAMRVAQIITKYIPDTESIKEMVGKDFGYKLFELASDQETLEIIRLLVGDSGGIPPATVINLCIETMIKNNLLELLTTYKTIGFN
jgi:hypothetical protein